tara:strand:+ start:457 stop:795 length:339 start_codon:yes stop_codon:yes gene_type:complete
VRNWKVIANTVAESHSGGQGILLDNPDFDFDMLPGWAVAYRHESPLLEVEGESLTAKDVRKFLWEHRNHRSVTRDRSFVWSKYDEELDTSTVGIGTLTVKPALERLNNGKTA